MVVMGDGRWAREGGGRLHACYRGYLVKSKITFVSSHDEYLDLVLHHGIAASTFPSKKKKNLLPAATSLKGRTPLRSDLGVACG